MCTNYNVFLSFTNLENELMVARREGWGDRIVREFGMDMYILLYLKWIISEDLLYRTGMLCDSLDGKAVGENGHMYTYSWVPLPFTWNYHNIVNWLCVCVWGGCVCAYTRILSPVWLLETPWTAACQAPLSTEFSRRERVVISHSRGSSHSGIETVSLVTPALSGRFFYPWASREVPNQLQSNIK